MLLPMQGQGVGAGMLSARLGRRMAQQLSQEEFSGPCGLGPCRGVPGATESQGWEGTPGFIMPPGPGLYRATLEREGGGWEAAMDHHWS